MIVVLFVIISLILKEELFTKSYPQNTDYRQITIDRNKYNLSNKEIDRRVFSGYYVKENSQLEEVRYDYGNV